MKPEDVAGMLTPEQRAALERGETVELAVTAGPGASLSLEQRKELDLDLSPENLRLANALPADRKETVRQRLLELVNANIKITNERVRVACLATRPEWKARVRSWHD